MRHSTSRVTKESSSSAPKCVLDRSIVNKNTVGNMTNIGLSVFAPLCGRNRGIFVLDPPDGRTYGCIEFPEKFAQIAGVTDTRGGVSIKDSNAIVDQFRVNNVSAAGTVKLLDKYIQLVYGSTADVDKLPYGCDVGGIGVLECGGDGGAAATTSLLVDGGPVRAVTLAGVFVPAPWVTGGRTLSMEEVSEFYTARDFEEMKALGLNTVQIPVPLEAFAGDGEDESVLDELTNVLGLIGDADLKAIIVLVDSTSTNDDNDAAVEAATGVAAKFAASNNNVLALTLSSKSLNAKAAARKVAPSLALLIPANQGDLQSLSAEENVYASLDMEHSTDIADIASSDSLNDRMKLYYHEATSCIARSPIEYASCYRNVPVFVSNGFDLSIDDCAMKEFEDFRDYGQCDRFDETIESSWWKRHRASMAQRQVFAYERGLGWSFKAWKLYNDTDADVDAGIIDSPVKLLALRHIAAAGLMPSFSDEEPPAPFACLNPPVSDFALGDETLAPTPAPPPDCGNGWWNYDLNACEYWIPPPPTVAPTPAPCRANNAEVHIAAATGAVVALLVGFVGMKFMGCSRRSAGYSSLA